MTNALPLRFSLLSLWLSCIALPSFAQTPPVFEVVVPGGTEITAGMPFEVQFRINRERTRGFKPPVFPGSFQIVSGPNLLESMVIENGKVTEQTAWSFEIIATKAGQYTLPPATLKMQGKTLQTQPLTIRIVENHPTTNVNVPPGADQNIFLVAEAVPEKAYVGQQITYRVRLFTQLNVESADLIQMPDFENFYFEEKRRFDTRASFTTEKNKKYAVRTLYEYALFPQQSGQFTLPPAKVKVNVERPNPFGPMFGTVPVLLETPEVLLNVNPLPDSLPPGFTGGVGEYVWEMAKNPDTVATGEAVALSFTFRGNGDPKHFIMPPLAVPAGLETFEPKTLEEESYENGEELVHTQTLEYILLPREPGRYVFRPSFLTFHPDSGRFVKAFPLDSIVVLAIPGPSYGVEVPLVDTTASETAPAPTVWRRFRETLPLGDEAPWWLGLLVLPVVLGLFYLTRRSTPRKVKAEPVANPVDEVKVAREHLARLQAQASVMPAKEFYDEVLKAVHHYLSARLDIPHGQLTKAVVQAYLADRRTPAAITNGFMHVWEHCEQMVFAPEASVPGTDAPDTWAAADAAVRGLEGWISGNR